MKKKHNFKNWYEKEIKTSDIFNNEIYREWGSKLNKKKTLDKFMLLYAKNTKRLKKIYGEQSATYLGEFRYYIWIIPFEKETFLVFSSNKGTSIEIVYDKCLDYFIDDKEIGNKIIKFVKHLLEKLEEVTDNE